MRVLRRRTRTLLETLALSSALAAIPTTAQAQGDARAEPQVLAAEVTYSARTGEREVGPLIVAACGGERTAQSARVEERGVALLQSALRTDPPAAQLVAEALHAFDEQCRLGDDFALERRAAALYLLERHVEAARTLDAFLMAHPLGSLDPAVRTRVEANQGMYYPRVASLRVESQIPGAVIAINDAAAVALDGRILRCPPGVVAFEVSAPGYAAIRRSVTVAPGETTNVHVDLHAEEPDEEPPPIAVGSQAARGESTRSPSRLPVVLMASGGVLLGVGVAGTLLRENRADTYNESGCTGNPRRRGCASVEGEHNTGKLLQLTGFIGGGLLLAGGLVWLLAGSTAEPEPNLVAGLHCDAILGEVRGLSCRGRF